MAHFDIEEELEQLIQDWEISPQFEIGPDLPLISPTISESSVLEEHEFRKLIPDFKPDLITKPMRETLLYNVSVEITKESDFKLHNCELQFCHMKGDISVDEEVERINANVCLSSFARNLTKKVNSAGDVDRPALFLESQIKESQEYYLSRGARPKTVISMKKRSRRILRKE
jgi:hypothetical protein